MTIDSNKKSLIMPHLSITRGGAVVVLLPYSQVTVSTLFKCILFSIISFVIIISNDIGSATHATFIVQCNGDIGHTPHDGAVTPFRDTQPCHIFIHFPEYKPQFIVN